MSCSPKNFPAGGENSSPAVLTVTVCNGLDRSGRLPCGNGRRAGNGCSGSVKQEMKTKTLMNRAILWLIPCILVPALNGQDTGNRAPRNQPNIVAASPDKTQA